LNVNSGPIIETEENASNNPGQRYTLMKRLFIGLVIFVGILAVTGIGFRSTIAWQWERYHQKAHLEDCYLGERAPDIDGFTQDNRIWSLRGLQGKVVVLDFTSMSCIHCGPAHKMLEQIQADLHDDDVVFVSISLDESIEDYRKSIVRRKFKWPLIWEPPDIYIHRVQRAYGIYALPSIWIIGRDGKVVDAHAHRFPPLIKSEILKALNK
jgi:peroxiredoxin